MRSRKAVCELLRRERRHEREAGLLLALRRRPLRLWVLHAERCVLHRMRLLLLLGLGHTTRRGKLLSLRGRLPPLLLLLLGLQKLQPRQRRKEHLCHWRALTRSWLGGDLGLQLHLLQHGHLGYNLGRAWMWVCMGMMGVWKRRVWRDVLLHCAQGPANRILVIPARHLEHPAAHRPEGRLHEAKVYFG